MARMDAVLACAFDRWSPGIGDPSAVGWATVAAYAVVALGGLLLAVCARRFFARHAETQRAFWACVAALFAALAVNKQLDLQSLLTAVGRCVAALDGWYAERREAQRLFILWLLGGMAGAAALLAFAFRRVLAVNAVAILGIALTMTFVAVRAVGFHHMDHLINQGLMGARVNWILELGGIGVTALGALVALAFGGRGHSRGEAASRRRSSA